MDNCIFAAHCPERICDNACIRSSECSYLMKRNDLSMRSSIYKASQSAYDYVTKSLDSIENHIGRLTIGADAPKDLKVMTNVDIANLLTYCAICQNWLGNNLHCSVYHLRFSTYVHAIKSSWTMGEDESLTYKKIWARSARILIVSNFEFVHFGDFECGELLNLVQERQASGFDTIFMVPDRGKIVTSHKTAFGSVVKDLIVGNRKNARSLLGGESG